MNIGELMATEQFIQRSNLKFAGVDEWYRLVFKHEQRGGYFCTVNRLWEDGDTKETVQQFLDNTDELYVKTPFKDFEGEPSHPVTVK
uniref:Phage protein n=1 Tax=Erwinia phage Fifi051 TaxID=3238787 RepID=A0AB39ACQ6_9CAUD